MSNIEEQKKGCRWMIRHYMDLANSCFNIYPDITDAYLVYDHYMVNVLYYERKYDELCQL